MGYLHARSSYYLFNIEIRNSFFSSHLNFLISDDTGIEVGRQFFSRSEMVVVGVHGHWLSGIDYIGDSYGQVLLLYLNIIRRNNKCSCLVYSSGNVPIFTFNFYYKRISLLTEQLKAFLCIQH